MSLLLIKNKLGSDIEVHAPERFTDDFGPIAFELDKRYVLYCRDHRKIAGDRSRHRAIARAKRPQRWCTSCRELFEAREAEIERLRASKAEIAAERKLKRETAAEKLSERKRLRLIGIGRHIGKGAPGVQRLREEREDRLRRLEADRESAKAYVTAQLAKGANLPAWMVALVQPPKKPKPSGRRQRVLKEIAEPVFIPPENKNPAVSCPSDELRDILKILHAKHFHLENDSPNTNE